MSAVVVDFSSVRARRIAAERAAPPAPSPAAAPSGIHFTFWCGASGTRYVHTIYPLIACPELPKANILLVRRHGSDRAEVVSIGRVEHAAPSLNLAEVRRLAAEAGAEEVHVHLLGSTEADRAMIEQDLATAGGWLRRGAVR